MEKNEGRTMHYCEKCAGVVASPDFIGDVVQEHVCVKPWSEYDLDCLDLLHDEDAAAEMRRLYRLLALRDAEAGRLRDALEGMVQQFAYWSSAKDKNGLWTGGLSALEQAFDVLGWDDPHPCPEQTCDEPGCTKQATEGVPTSKGYRRTCLKHCPDWRTRHGQAQEGDNARPA